MYKKPTKQTLKEKLKSGKALYVGREMSGQDILLCAYYED